MGREVLFLIQSRSYGSSSRGKMAGGRILTKEDMLDPKYYGSCTGWIAQTYYQFGRGTSKNLKSMSVEEFREYFKDEIGTDKLMHLFGDESPFRAEVKKFYLNSLNTGKSTNKGSSEYNQRYPRGSIVQDKTGNYFYYLGKASRFEIFEEDTQRVCLDSDKHVYILLDDEEINEVSGIKCEPIRRQLAKLYYTSNWGKFLKYSTKTKKVAKWCTDAVSAKVVNKGFCYINPFSPMNYRDVNFKIVWELIN